MKKIIIITADGIRHKAFKVILSNQKGIKVLATIVEEGDVKLSKIENEQISEKFIKDPLKQHILDRDKTEKDFFSSKKSVSNFF